MTKVYDPKFIGIKEGNPALENPYLSQFDHTISLYAQHKNISKEEAQSEILVEFDKLEDPANHDEIKRALELSITQANEAEREAEEEAEKYPYLSLLYKLDEKMAEALNIPREVLCKV